MKKLIWTLILCLTLANPLYALSGPSVGGGGEAAGGVDDHGGLSGLADDDHAQYRLESADHSHESTGLQGGQLDHGLSLIGLLDDDHTIYRLESADHTHQSTGLQAGQLDHGLSLIGLTDDDHTQYVLAAGDTVTGLLDTNVAGLALDVQNTTDAASNQVGIFRAGDRTTAADDDEGFISYTLEDSAGSQVEHARIIFGSDDVTAGTVDGLYKIQVVRDGTLLDALTIRSNEASDAGEFIINESNSNRLNFSVATLNTATIISTSSSLDSVTIRSVAFLATFGIDGGADRIHLVVQGIGGQTADLVVFEQSDGTDVFNVSNSGQTTVGGMLIQNTVTIAVDDTTPDVSLGNIFTTSANTVATAITDLDLPQVGQIVYIVGGSDTNASTIADSGNFNLSAAFTANLDDTLVLFVQADNDYVELSRSDN